MDTSSRSARVLLLSLVLFGCGVGAARLQAQEGTAALIVSVRAGASGQALPGAHVVVQGMGIGGATDAQGVARLTGLQPGSRRLEVRYLGYAPQTAQVMLEAGRVATVSFDLLVQPIELAAVKVRARPSILYTNGFHQRRSSGFGTFITREQIEDMRPRFLSDVLRRVAGVSLTPTRMGGTSRASFRGSKVLSNCPIQYYVDGTMAMYFNIDEVQPGDVEGLEIYRGAATIPPAFNKGTAMCGVVVIWTRVR